MKILILFFMLFIISCGKGNNFENNYYIDKIEGFSSQETLIINQAILELKESSPGLFNGEKPLIIEKTSGSEFGEIDYREFYCQIRLNPQLTSIFSQELALKYLLLHQIGKCHQLPLSFNQEEIMFYQFNSFLIPKIPEKLPDFAKKLKN